MRRVQRLRRAVELPGQRAHAQAGAQPRTAPRRHRRREQQAELPVRHELHVPVRGIARSAATAGLLASVARDARRNTRSTRPPASACRHRIRSRRSSPGSTARRGTQRGHRHDHRRHTDFNCDGDKTDTALEADINGDTEKTLLRQSAVDWSPSGSTAARSAAERRARRSRRSTKGRSRSSRRRPTCSSRRRERRPRRPRTPRRARHAWAARPAAPVRRWSSPSSTARRRSTGARRASSRFGNHGQRDGEHSRPRSGAGDHVPLPAVVRSDTHVVAGADRTVTTPAGSAEPELPDQPDPSFGAGGWTEIGATDDPTSSPSCVQAPGYRTVACSPSAAATST